MELLKNKVELNPDVIILFHKDLEYVITETILDLDFKKNEIDNSLYNFDELDNYKNEITFNDKIYTLNSCIICNFNTSDINHFILGMTCDNKRFVYNGLIKSSVFPCKLIEYDWDLQKIHKDFELNRDNCSLNFENLKSNLKFNFEKGNRILIYVKNTKLYK